MNHRKSSSMNEIGITERGDAALDLSWLEWVQDGKPAILITKNPSKLLSELIYHLPYSKKFNIIIHCTITGMGGTILEPNVPKKMDSIGAYLKLISFYGIDRVVLRIDPIIPVPSGITLAKSVAGHKKGRLRISFLDLYPHIKTRLKTAGIEFPWDSFHAPYKHRKEAYEELGRPEICGEPDFECTGCISKIDCETLNVAPEVANKSQRQFCACLINKKELLNSKYPCSHKCIYCYWKS